MGNWLSHSCVIQIVKSKTINKTAMTQYIDRKIKSSIAAAGVCGTIIFVLIQIYPENAMTAPISFIHIIFLIGMAAGILAVLWTGNSIKTSHDLVVVALITGFIFSLICVCGVVYDTILQGKFPGATLSNLTNLVYIFVMLFIISFMASLGAGSLFVQHALKRPIDEDDSN
jgi:peptidoglycan/LPS O-acetylase OafA/YrhL